MSLNGSSASIDDAPERSLVCPGPKSTRKSPGENVSPRPLVVGCVPGASTRSNVTPILTSENDSFSNEKMSSTSSSLNTMLPHTAKLDVIVDVYGACAACS